MLLAFIIFHLSVLVAANPFHKYPFVFLLDVGNEELEKTNSEQIRISVPGGSIALRYPAIGDGNTISHVRVSGIDFGTDLKSNIVDGGPGYKYVVLVFMGNPGTPYDAVLTVQTVDDSVLLEQNIGNVVNSEDQNEEDLNNSAEDLSDSEEVNNNDQSEVLQSSKAELMQSSSNVYRYADYQSMDEDKDDEGGADEEVNASNGDDEETGDGTYSDEASEELEDADGIESQKDLHSQYTDDDHQEDDPAVQVKGIDEDDDNVDETDIDENEIGSKEEQYSSDDYADAKSKIDGDLYSKYEELKEHQNLGGDYSKEYYQQNFKPVYQEDPSDYEDSDSGRPVYDDELYGVDKHKDLNNNNDIDSDDSYAVAY